MRFLFFISFVIILSTFVRNYELYGFCCCDKEKIKAIFQKSSKNGNGILSKTENILYGDMLGNTRSIPRCGAGGEKIEKHEDNTERSSLLLKMLRDVELTKPSIQVKYNSGKTNEQNAEDFIKWFSDNKSKLEKALKTYCLEFKDINNVVTDNGGVRRSVYNYTKNLILGNEDLFEPKEVGEKIYFSFTEENIIPKEDKNAYELLGYLVAASLRDYHEKQPTLLKLNPLIYKVILNGCEITKGLFSFDDCKYYSFLAWKNLKDGCEKKQKDRYLNELKTSMEKQLPRIKIFADSLSKFLNVENFNIFDFFKKDKFLELKLFLEGEEDITYEIFMKNFDWSGELSYEKKGYIPFQTAFQKVLEKLDKLQFRKLLVYMTGYDTFCSNKKLSVAFDDKIEKDGRFYPFKSHTCGLSLDISKAFFENFSGDELVEEMKRILLLTIEGDEGFNNH